MASTAEEKAPPLGTLPDGMDTGVVSLVEGRARAHTRVSGCEHTPARADYAWGGAGARTLP